MGAWIDGDNIIQKVGSGWVMTVGSDTYTNATDSTFPPLTGWSAGAPTVGYLDSPWVSESTAEYLPVSYSDLRARVNGAGRLYMKCLDIDGVPHYKELATYRGDTEFLPAEANKNDRYFGDNCGTGYASLHDVDGELITDSEGNVIFTS